MGFTTKKKTIEEAVLNFYYPQDKITWGTHYKKNYFDALMTKELISNKHNGVSNTKNMHSLITAMNTFHTPSFIPKQVPSLCEYAKSKRTSLDMDKVLSKIPDMKEFISSSMDDFSLGAYYYLQEKLKDKEFNHNDLTFKDSKFIYKIDEINETYEGIDYNEPKPIISEDMPLVPIREPLPTKEPLSKLGIYLDVEKHINDYCVKPLREELKSKYGVDYNDSSKGVLERAFIIDFVKDNGDGTYKVEVSAEYTWNGQIFSIEEYLNYVLEGFENLRGLVERSIRTRYNEETSIYPHSEEVKEKYYKFVQVMITLDIDKNLLDLYSDTIEEETDIMYIKYLDKNDTIKIAKITNYLDVIEIISDIRLTARYSLKGGNLRNYKPEDETRQERLYRLALEKVGYKKKYKKRYPKQEKDSKDIVQELKANDKVKYADIYQVINLFPMLIKENRQKLGYIKYYEAVVKYFDKIVGGFPEYVAGYERTITYKLSEKEYKVMSCNLPPNTTVTHEDDGRYTIKTVVNEIDIKYHYTTSLPNMDRTNISCGVVGIKRYVEGEFTKKCFIGVEPNVGGMWLYVNVPDKEKKSYMQYALNMHCWFSNFNFKKPSRSLRGRSKKDIPNSFPPVMLRLKDTKEWYNDGNQEINAKEYEYDSTYEYSYGEKSYQKRAGGSKFIVEFEFDDRCNINYHKKYEEKLIQLHKAMPVMPIKLWQKVPYCGKKEVAHHTIVLYCFISYTVKVKRGFFKAIGFFVGIGLMAFGQVWAGALSFGSSLASNMGLFDNSFGKLIQLAITVYTGYLTVANATSALGQAVSTASTALKVTNGIMNYTQQAKINKAMNEYNSLMGISSNEMKELNQKLLEHMMKGINLRDYDVDVDYSSEIDLMYYIAYGGLLFNDFYDEEAYTSSYKIYNEFERFK